MVCHQLYSCWLPFISSICKTVIQFVGASKIAILFTFCYPTSYSIFKGCARSSLMSLLNAAVCILLLLVHRACAWKACANMSTLHCPGVTFIGYPSPSYSCMWCSVKYFKWLDYSPAILALRKGFQVLECLSIGIKAGCWAIRKGHLLSDWPKRLSKVSKSVIRWEGGS